MKGKILLAALIAAVCAGLCAVSLVRTRDGAEETSGSDTQEVTTLTWYINFSWFNTEWGQNIVSQKITEDTGVNIEFIVPKGTEGAKLDSMINSGTLPDLVTLGWWEVQNLEMIEAGMVYPLNRLAEEYCPDFFDVTDEAQVQWYTQSDGNIYGYPNYSYTYEDYQNNSLTSHQNFLVRKDIYEAIGSPDMTTPEGFMEAVKAAAQMFPQVDGEELIPIGCESFTDDGCTSFDSYLLNFLAVPYEKDGQYYDRYTDPEYIRWLKVFRQLGEEGYLKDAIFIDRRSQLEKKLENGQYFCLLYQNKDIEEIQKYIYQKDPDRVYMAVEGPRNSSGDDPVLPVQGINGWTLTYVSKNCKDPEKAIEFMTYLLSDEGQKMVCLGEKGTMYTQEGDEAVMDPQVWSVLSTDRKTYNDIYGGNDTYWMLQKGSAQLRWPTPKIDCFEQLLDWTRPYVAYTGQYDLSFSDSQTSALYDRMKYLWGETLPKLLMAESDEEFDRILEDYVAQREEDGYDRFVAAATRQYQLNKQRLGMEE